MDSCAGELNAGNNNQIFMGVKNPSFQELTEVLTQGIHDYSAAQSMGFGQLCFATEQRHSLTNITRYFLAGHGYQ